MAYVKIPKNINEIEAKVIGNFTKRQIITGIIAIIVSIPLFIILKKINQTLALYTLFATAFPIFFLGFYKKEGVYFDKRIINYLKRVLFNKKIRVIKNETYIDKINNFVQNEQNRKDNK